MKDWKHILTNSGILDTETFGLERGAGVNQAAWYNLDTNTINEWRVSPHLVRYANKKDEVSRLADYSSEKHELVRYASWDKAKEEYKKLTKLDTRWMEKHYVAQHTPVDPSTFSARGIAFNTQDIDVADLPSAIKSSMQGKTVWIANAPFESKQIGAITNALRDFNFREHIETQGTSDPLFVTGKEVQDARAKAILTGDWSHVWKAYLQHVPKPGETAVRDIQDVLRAMMSYGKKVGLVDFQKPYFGTAIDTTYRLFGLVESSPADVVKKLLEEETHIAAKDVIQEAEVLRKAGHYTYALQNVAEDTEYGRFLREEARNNRGALYEISKYFEGLKIVQPKIEEINLLKRFERAKRDIEENGVTTQVIGQRIYARPREELTPSGQKVSVSAVEQIREDFSSLSEVADLIKKQGQYKNEMIDSVLKVAETESTTDLATMIMDKKSLFDQSWKTNVIGLSNIHGALPKKVPNMHLLGAGILAMSVLFASPEYKVEEYTEYNKYLARENYKKLNHQGINAEMRPLNTDFGSPYKGMEVSQGVIQDAELLREREKYLAQQYGAMIYEPDLYSPISRLANRAKEAMPRGYRLLTGGDKFNEGQMPSVSGAGRSIDISSWYIEPEDADTFRLYEPGVAGFMRRTLGLEPYKFRVAGIDAPETAHQFKAQPFGYEAKNIFKDMIESGKNIQLVYNPSDTTYGRSVGTLVIDGKNASEELIKQGAAGALSYEKGGKSLLSYTRLRRIEDDARRANRGMWAEPYFQTVRNFDPHGDIPFNRLINPQKYGASSYYQEIVSAAETAQKQGTIYQPSFIPDDVNREDRVKPSLVSSRDFMHSQLQARIKRQYINAQSQQEVLKKMKQSPINHHRM